MAERRTSCQQLMVWVRLYECRSCGRAESGDVLEITRNDFRSRALADSGLGPEQLIAVGQTMPYGWIRIDPLNTSHYIFDNVYCSDCAPLICTAMDLAREGVINQLAEKAILESERFNTR